MSGPRLGFWRNIRCSLLSAFAPNFWRDFPKKDEPGPWMAVAIRTNPFNGGHEARTSLVKGGEFEAYIVARELAVELDCNTPKIEDIGIAWAVRKPTTEELEGVAA